MQTQNDERPGRQPEASYGTQNGVDPIGANGTAPALHPLTHVPAALKELRRWVAWGPDPESGKPKCPLVASDRKRRASTRIPETWAEFKFAAQVRERFCDDKKTGIGFVFTKGDGLIYIDIDDCLDENGACRDWAFDFVAVFHGKAYIEKSPSGRGLHIIGRGTLPVPEGASGGKASFPDDASGERVPEVAMFCDGKYTTITGRVWEGSAAFQDITEAAAKVWAAAGIQIAAPGSQSAGKAPVGDKLPEVNQKKLTKKAREEFKACGAADAPDRSAARFALYADLAERFTPEEIFALVVRDYPEWYAASGAAEKGREQTWADIHRCAAKSKASKEEFQVIEEREKEARTTWKELGIDVKVRMTKDGPVHEAVWGPANISRYFAKHPKWKQRLRFNEFSRVVELDGAPLTDDFQLVPLGTEVRKFFQYDIEPHTHFLWSAAMQAASENRYNPVVDYLTGLKWDTTERLSSLPATLGLEDTPLNRDIMRKWVISLVARAMKPGCKVDTVLILEGEEGLKKSTLFSEFAGGASYFTDTHIDMDSKDGLQVMAGNWIVEFAELGSLRRKEVNRAKQFFSSSTDKFRPPYGRSSKDHPRHFVVVGSTNDDEYLESTTGNRRFWPVKVVEKLDVKWFREHRDQIFAEAVFAFTKGEPWWFENQSEELKEAQESRRTSDPLADNVVAFLAQMRKEEVTTFTIPMLMDRLGYGAERLDIQNRIAAILRGQGIVKRKRRVGGSKPMNYWSDPTTPEGRGVGEVRVLPLGGAAPRAAATEEA